MTDSVVPKRKNIRLKDYDYSSNGCYFVTICVKDKQHLLSKIVGDDALIVPKKIILKPYGEIVEKHFQSAWNYIEYNTLKEYK